MCGCSGLAAPAAGRNGSPQMPARSYSFMVVPQKTPFPSPPDGTAAACRLFSLSSMQKGMGKAGIITAKRSLASCINIKGDHRLQRGCRTTAGWRTSCNFCLNGYICVTRQPHTNLNAVLLLHYEDTCFNNLKFRKMNGLLIIF